MKRMRFGRLIISVLVAGGTIATSTAFGFDLRRHLDERQTLPRSAKAFELNTVGASLQKSSRGLQLLQAGRLDFSDTIKSLIRDAVVHPRLQLRINDASQPFYLNQKVTTKDIRFAIGDVEICRFHMRAHRLSDGSLFMLGRLPDIGSYEVIPGTDGPHLSDVLSVVKKHVGSDDLKLVSAKRCIHNSGGSLLPAWDMTVRDGILPYHILADAYEVIDVQDGFFTVDGTALVHAQNANDGERIEVKLVDLKGDGTLTSPYLKALARDDNFEHKQTAVADDHIFDFPVEDPRYDEVSAYSYAQMHYDFFKDIGFVWYGPKPMEIKVHERPGGQTNNALFIPADSAGEDLPTIFVGDGDGSILKDLPRDGDVISHEFGHHVIYQTLKSTKGQSLVLHEGLADFFAFSRTGDACLGESICPKNSSACWVPAQCLRTADNNLKFEDQTYNAVQGHLQGQVISGMLWDLRKSNAIPGEDVTRLTYKSVSFLEEESGFRHFLLAMFNADKELFAGKYLDRIKEAAEARGFGELVADISPGNTIPLPRDEPSSLTPNIQDTGPKKEEKTESESGDNFFECAVVPGSTGSGNLLVLLLLLAFPLLTMLTPKRQPQRIERSPRKQKKDRSKGK